MNSARRLVVVSNRVATEKSAAGGLTVAVGEALAASGGLWFGSSGEVVERADGGTPGEGRLNVVQGGPVTLATVDLCREDHDAYYRGYANSTLWPIFHCRLDLADFDESYVEGYRRVNRMFARELAPLLRADDMIWVHDYHLIPLGAELRSLGCRQRIGFFQHIPLPPPVILAALPAHAWLMRTLFAYDLVGLQTQTDLGHLSQYLCKEAGAERLSEHKFRAFNRVLRAGAYPIGIDVDAFTALALGTEAQHTFSTLREKRIAAVRSWRMRSGENLSRRAKIGSQGFCPRVSLSPIRKMTTPKGVESPGIGSTQNGRASSIKSSAMPRPLSALSSSPIETGTSVS